ncbi:hypothetical protein ACQ86G_29960 [Roseateles chitinivorans]|uniref:hypothetical protein n=1 Tax=Roseateles chitinivorans TaxID=2917965 RepID=UPI003D66DEFA
MTTTTRARIRLTTIALLLAGGAATGPARASGFDDANDFVAESRTEIRLDRYVQGQLGVVLPTYSRPMLYTAWRAIASADAHRPLVPIAGEWLDKACCDAGAGQSSWEPERQPSVAAWLAARQELVAEPPRWRPGTMKETAPRSYVEFLNCPDGAYAFAVETLARLRQRPDATPARLRAWVDGQDLVFAQCAPDLAAKAFPPPKTPPVAPPALTDLPANEALAWRQARQYQRAASAFYSGDWATAESGFAAIAADDGHPWQAWASLARMRTLVREASLATPGQPDGIGGPRRLPTVLLDRLQPLAARIASHADWPVQREAAEKLLNLVRAQTDPERRFAQLSRELALLDQAPAPQSLADWARIADHWLDGGPDGAQRTRFPQVGALPVMDWILAFRHCGTEPSSTPPSASAVAAQVARWKTRPDSVLWLIPAMSCAHGDLLAKDAATWRTLQAAADRVPASHPGWMTVRLEQVRLLREAGEFDRARAQLTALTATPAPTPSARNLIAEESLKLARTPADALPWLSREYGTWSRFNGGDTPYPYDFPPPKQRALDNDGVEVLLGRFGLSEWKAAVASTAVAPSIRAQLAFGLWWRAELTGRTELARGAATALAGLLPRADGEALTGPYLGATTDAERRAALWRASVTRPGLSAAPISGMGSVDVVSGLKAGDPQEAAAGMWCQLDTNGGVADAKDAATRNPVPGAVSGWPTPEALAQERAALRTVGSATGAYAKWVLAESRRPDRPADLPWLLYVGIQSTKGGCVDKDNSAQSKAMFQTLHRLYPKSEWAKRSPYFY